MAKTRPRILGPVRPRDGGTYGDFIVKKQSFSLDRPLNKVLKRIDQRVKDKTKQANERVTLAIETGKVKTLLVNGKQVICAKRQRVGKYFSANGGSIEQSMSSKVRMQPKPKSVTLAQSPTLVKKEREVRSTDKYKMLNPKTGKSVSITVPKLPHYMR